MASIGQAASDRNCFLGQQIAPCHLCASLTGTRVGRPHHTRPVLRAESRGTGVKAASGDTRERYLLLYQETEGAKVRAGGPQERYARWWDRGENAMRAVFAQLTAQGRPRGRGLRIDCQIRQARCRTVGCLSVTDVRLSPHPPLSLSLFF